MNTRLSILSRWFCGDGASQKLSQPSINSSRNRYFEKCGRHKSWRSSSELKNAYSVFILAYFPVLWAWEWLLGQKIIKLNFLEMTYDLSCCLLSKARNYRYLSPSVTVLRAIKLWWFVIMGFMAQNQRQNHQNYPEKKTIEKDGKTLPITLEQNATKVRLLWATIRPNIAWIIDMECLISYGWFFSARNSCFSTPLSNFWGMFMS